MKNDNFESPCDERKFLLNGNYIINFVNCSIKIRDKIFNNKISEFIERFIIPYSEEINLHEDILNFEEITLNQENIKIIQRIKISQNY